MATNILASGKLEAMHRLTEGTLEDETEMGPGKIDPLPRAAAADDRFPDPPPAQRAGPLFIDPLEGACAGRADDAALFSTPPAVGGADDIEGGS